MSADWETSFTTRPLIPSRSLPTCGPGLLSGPLSGMKQLEQQTATAGVLQSSIPRPAISRARVGRMLDKAMRLCARWWRKFSTSVIYPVASNLCD
jgi:hypothetical protein